MGQSINHSPGRQIYQSTFVLTPTTSKPPGDGGVHSGWIPERGGRDRRVQLGIISIKSRKLIAVYLSYCQKRPGGKYGNESVAVAYAETAATAKNANINSDYALLLLVPVDADRGFLQPFEERSHTCLPETCSQYLVLEMTFYFPCRHG